MIVIDSDVLIWLTRGHAGAKARLAQINPWPYLNDYLHRTRPKLPQQG